MSEEYWDIGDVINPGDEYKKTRHNMGFQVIDKLLNKWNLNLNKEDSYQDIVIALLETMARERDIEKFKIYSLGEFLNLIVDNEKDSNFQNKIQLSLSGLKRKAIENITQVNMDVINEKLVCLLNDDE